MAGSRPDTGYQIAGPDGKVVTLQEFLGQGSFGQVWRGELDDGRSVAVKFLSDLGSNSALQAILNEARVAARIVHPNVVQILHASEPDPGGLGPYLISEYVSGGTLETLLTECLTTKAPLNIAHCRDLMTKIAQGAKAVNAVCIHRDIKPDNILLDRGNPKLTDFGISKLIEEATRSRTFKGRQHYWYMAPEAWVMETNTFKLDVYAVGLLFYQILTLEHPYLKGLGPRVNDERAWQEAHLYTAATNPRDLRADVPLPLAQLLLRMVHKKPDKRPDWDDVLNRLSEGSDTQTPPHDLSPTVEAALKRQQSLDKVLLQADKEMATLKQTVQLYDQAWQMLMQEWDEIIQAFNRDYQHGQIIKEGVHPAFLYKLPTGEVIECTLFPRCLEGAIPGTGKPVIGAGYIGARGSGHPGGNVFLGRESPDDPYGTWRGVRARVNALVDPRKLSRRGHHRTYETLFGFTDAQEFYSEFAHFSALHVYDFEMRPEPSEMFKEILHEIIAGKPK